MRLRERKPAEKTRIGERDGLKGRPGLVQVVDHVKPVPPVRTGVRLDEVVAVAVVAGVCVAVLRLTLLTTFNGYDEGVYHYEAVLWVRGLAPYSDVFVPQPPGIVLIGAASELVGSGIVGTRLVSLLCGVLALYQTYRLGRRAAQEWQVPNRLAGAVAALLFALSYWFLFLAARGGTEVIALCPVLAAIDLLLGTRRHRYLLAGLLLGAATLIRLQAASLVPGLVFLIGAGTGVRGAGLPTAAFLGGLAAVAVPGHGLLALVVPHYADCVVWFQMERARFGFGTRMQKLEGALLRAVPAFTILAAAVIAVLPRVGPAARGLAWFTLTTVVATTFTGASLYEPYYLVALPALAVCGALVLVRVGGLGSRPWGVSILIGLATVTAGPSLVGHYRDVTGRDAEHRECVRQVAAMPGGRVLTTDGRIALLAGKRLPDDYYAGDPNALYQLAPDRFHDWFARLLPAADVVVVTTELAGWLGEGNVRDLAASGKPLVFESEAASEKFFKRRDVRAAFPPR